MSGLLLEPFPRIHWPSEEPDKEAYTKVEPPEGACLFPMWRDTWQRQLAQLPSGCDLNKPTNVLCRTNPNTLIAEEKPNVKFEGRE